MDIEIIEGDAIDQMQRLVSKQFAAIVTSPPYNLGVNQGKSGPGGIPAKGRWAPGYADIRPDYIGYHRRALELMLSLLQPDGLIWYVHRRQSIAKPSGGRRDVDAVLAGFPVRAEIVWDKGRPGPGFCAAGRLGGAYYPTPAYETIFLLPASDNALLDRRVASAGNVWRIPREANRHPASFPVELATRCISATLATGAVLDPFCGSGTTGLAAAAAGRPFVGIDLSADYCAMAISRLARLF